MSPMQWTEWTESTQSTQLSLWQTRAKDFADFAKAKSDSGNWVTYMGATGTAILAALAVHGTYAATARCITRSHMEACPMKGIET